MIQPFEAIKNVRITALLEKPPAKKYKPIILATKKSQERKKPKDKSPILDKSQFSLDLNNLWTSRNHPEIAGSSGSSLPITSKSFNTKRATIKLPKNAQKSIDSGTYRKKTPGSRPSP